MEEMSFYTKEGESIYKYEGLHSCLVEDDVVSIFTENNKIRMVGIYNFSNGMKWYSFPKYYSIQPFKNELSQTDVDNLSTIVRVIEKLRENGKNVFEGVPLFDADRHMNEKKKVDHYHLSKLLVNDYVQNGLYEKNNVVLQRGVRGRTAWSSTIRKCLPLVGDDYLIYDSPFVRKKQIDENDIIRSIHASVICAAIDVYEKVYPERKIKKPDNGKLYPVEQLKECTKILERELLSVFSDRDQNLIKAMIAWCSLTTNYKLVGCTNCFLNVWEWVNDAVFGNVRKKESGYPSYFLRDAENVEKKYVGTGNAKPDTLFFSKAASDNNYVLHVYDAKYYVPRLTAKDEIYGYPANSDIVKQISYMNKIKESLAPIAENTSFKNIFLLPESQEILDKGIGQTNDMGNLYREIGYTVQADFDDAAHTMLESVEVDFEPSIIQGDEKVYLYMVYCSELYKRYLEDRIPYSPV